MLLTAYILINHLDNCARPSKCLNDQGGNDSDTQAYYDIGSQQRQEQFTFPIAFKSKPLYVHPYAINKVELRHLSRIGFSDSQITSTGFAAVISENSNAVEQIKMRYIAIGI